MKVRCKKTKRFLLEIDIEEYLENLRLIGIKQEIPLEIIIPCPRCHKKEEYAIYPTHYEFIKNHETTIKVDSSVIVDK
jgi:phage FluMu protein Com